ncbi:hypothetical protein ACIQVO_14690 [Streptomyces sp. NPDC101062]|uniref:hypothetical protein n=1 Tax=unclassified Streptomyces TaxID=2593676 RepID=UPI0037F89ADE
MPDEREIHVWLTESAARLNTLPIGATPPAPEIRRLGSRRRKRRALSLAAGIAVAAFGATSYMISLSAQQTAANPAAPATSTVQREKARETLRAYYTALPDALASPDKDKALTELMSTYVSPSALRSNASAGQDGSAHPAATCEAVTARTIFSVGDPRGVGTHTVRIEVTSSSGAGPIGVTFDLRTKRISKWTCPLEPADTPRTTISPSSP